MRLHQYTYASVILHFRQFYVLKYHFFLIEIPTNFQTNFPVYTDAPLFCHAYLHYHKRQTLFRWLSSARQRDDVTTCASTSVMTSEYCKSSVTFRKSRGTLAVICHVLFTFCYCYGTNVARKWFVNNNSCDVRILPFFSFDDMTGKVTGANAVQEKGPSKCSHQNTRSGHQQHVISY